MSRTTTSRRQLLAATPALALGTFLLDPAARAGEDPDAATPPSAPELHPDYPSQEPSRVREMVAVSHGNFERVRELVEERPELAKAAWDWGFGDWETALGAASHVGRPDIARYLIEHGARPDIFTAAMLGNLDAVRAFVAASPGIQRLHGPHGITLLAHARFGKEPAAAVVAYLQELGDADVGYEDRPLADEERQALLGTYRFGGRPEDRFEVVLSRQGQLAVRRAEGTIRFLYHRGGYRFLPSGAPSVDIRFLVADGRGEELTIHHADLVVAARRV